MKCEYINKRIIFVAIFIYIFGVLFYARHMFTKRQVDVDPQKKFDCIVVFLFLYSFAPIVNNNIAFRKPVTVSFAIYFFYQDHLSYVYLVYSKFYVFLVC